MKYGNSDIGVGATQELPLRVSVGALVRVIFKHPGTGLQVLALERTATLVETGAKPKVVVKAKPFGGGVLLTNPQKLKDLIGNFHYDSERSRQEGDFRIQVNPSSWNKVKDLCLKHMTALESGVFDPGPEREIEEEFEDSLKIKITPVDYKLERRSLIVEDLPEITDNINAMGLPTVRIYYLFEAEINHKDLIEMMLENSRRYSDRDLQKIALADADHGGKGRANALLTVNLEEIQRLYLSIPLERRGETVYIGEHQLDGNVPAILEEIDHIKYQRYTELSSGF